MKKMRSLMHPPAYQVQPEEHGQRQRDVHRDPLRPDLAPVVGQLGRPQEVVPAGDGVHGADEDLDANLHDPLPRHGDAPVVGAVVDHEQLEQRGWLL